MFLPGNPPAQKRETIEGRNKKVQKPGYLNKFGDDIISSGCKCLDIPVKTIVASKTAISTVTVGQDLPVSDFSTTDSAKSKTGTTTTPLSTSTATQTVAGKTTTLYRKSSHVHRKGIWWELTRCSMRNTPANEHPNHSIRRCTVPNRPQRREPALRPQYARRCKRRSLLQHLLLRHHQLHPSLLVLLRGLRGPASRRSGKWCGYLELLP